jgi:hypothetical protein
MERHSHRRIFLLNGRHKIFTKALEIISLTHTEDIFCDSQSGFRGNKPTIEQRIRDTLKEYEEYNTIHKFPLTTNRSVIVHTNAICIKQEVKWEYSKIQYIY